MKLERASLLAVIACFTCLLLLLLFAAWSSQQLTRERSELETLQDLRARLDDLSVAADGLLLFVPQPALAKAFHLEARELQAMLAAMPDASGRALHVVDHINRIRHLLSQVDAPGEAGPGEAAWAAFPTGNTTDALRRLTLIADVSNQGIAIEQAFAALMNERQAAIYGDVGTLVATFMLAAAGFGFVCIATFAYIHRRIATSISAIATSVEQIRDGKTYLRLPMQRSDEVGALTASINRLLDSQTDAINKIDAQRQQIRQQAELLTVAGEVGEIGGWSLMLGEERVTWSDVIAKIHGKPQGYSPTIEEAIQFYREEDQARIRKAFMACVDHAVPYSERLQIIDSNGEMHWVRTAGVPVRNDLGRIIGVHGALQDVTEHMETEQQLRHTQRLESLGQLTGGIAHDFNNILTVILGNTELLVEEFEDDENLGALARMIRDSAERGARLTHQLLAFARRQTLHPQAMNLDQVLDGIHDMLDRAIGETVTLVRRRSDALWSCKLDGAQFENAVLNLALNARDAMPEGGTLTLATTNYRHEKGSSPPVPGMTPGDYVHLQLSDTGSGIAQADMERLFEPFFTTKPKGQGTGLGLPMVYGFVTQSEGFIDISSRVGEGTVVALYFP
ncbi:MAG: ATP-binding protein, partial [Chromatocurvus sp.]